MKKVIPIFIFAFLISCTKESHTPVKSNRYTFEKIDEGHIHNDLVKIIIGQVAEYPRNQAEIEELLGRSKQPMAKYLSSELNVPVKEIFDVMESIDLNLVIDIHTSNDFNIKSILENAQLSPELTNSLTALVDLYFATEKLSVTSLDQVSMEYLKNSQLQPEDRHLLEATTNVLMASANLWLPFEQGGEGLYEQLNRKKPNFSARYLGLYGILLADAVGVVGGAAGSVAASGGAAALPNPLLGGLPTASLVGVISGATASITKAIN
ncbi:MAG: hypothetical protein IPL46_10245 [Saprospiraceae bacterium]|nr:hypothetical protein [Saprospiraceae bacterium]